MKTATQTSRVDAVFRAFSDRTRLRILNLLRGRKELCVCDIISVLDLPQAKVSRHLACLRQAELVDTRRDGQWVYYRLSKAEGAFHRKMLECLKCCLTEVPELQADRARLESGRLLDGPAGCC